jgi:hypothetical protein
VGVSRLPIIAAFTALAALPSLFPATALADTYQIYNLGDANADTPFGITASGAVVVQAPNYGPGGDFLYQTYIDGELTSTSATIPTLDYDDGTPCTPTVASGVTWNPAVGQTRCNGSHEVYFGLFPDDARGIFTGSGDSDYLAESSILTAAGGSLDLVIMNASGDFAWSDGLNDSIFEAVDLTTTNPPVPEPSSLLLLATGALTLIPGVTGAIRRRRKQ